MIHALVMTGAGVAGLLVFTFIAHAANRHRDKDFVNGGRLFVWIWLLVCVTNFVEGVFRAGVSPLAALGVFVVTFGLPAVLALLIAGSLRRHRLRTQA